MYSGQTGVVREHALTAVDSIFAVVYVDVYLEMALSSWRAKIETEGLSLEDAFKPLLDLRFADDTVLFCKTLDKKRAFCWMSWLPRLHEQAWHAA